VAPVREEEAAGADPNRAGFDADGSVQEVPLALPEAPPFPLPLAEAPASAEAGTFLHAVFEHLDFAQAKLGPETLRPVVDTQLRLHAQDPVRWGPELPAALAAVLTTPLELPTRSGLFDPHPTPGFCLADIPRKARLDELRFDLPIAGGSTFGRDPTVQPVTGESLRKVLELRRGALPGPWLDSLAGLPIGELAGFLTGSIDLVFRHHGRWYVVDYKSNRLAPRGQTLDAAHYRPEALSAAMSEHHYFLQYHLYTLALFRFLSSRLRGAWEPERDWGGVYYLFIRGMAGPETPTYAARPAGVFFDRPPVAAIAALDHLFRTGETTACP
jgi:exodeoxyribonuclease V beta subunit